MSETNSEKKVNPPLRPALRREAYDTLAYFEWLAEKALDHHNMPEHERWARRYHRLKSAIESNDEMAVLAIQIV